MFHLLQILTTVLIAVAMSPALAHALEYPGKMRLSRDTYLSVQSIYYPGFTIVGGIAAVAGTFASMLLLILTTAGSAAFWLTGVAVLAMVGMQVVFWSYTQPVNRFWLQMTTLGTIGEVFFFAFSPSAPADLEGEPDWRSLRDRWEYSHIVRAALVFVAFLAMLLTIVVSA